MAPDAHNKFFLKVIFLATCKYFDSVVEQWIREEILVSVLAAEVGCHFDEH